LKKLDSLRAWYSLNNTYYPFVNQEFNIQYLDPKVLNLSYQGPFWDVNRNICNVSFVTIAFNLGFGQTACAGIGLTGNLDNLIYNSSLLTNLI
jgi:hypothetical protein